MQKACEWSPLGRRSPTVTHRGGRCLDEEGPLEDMCNRPSMRSPWSTSTHEKLSRGSKQKMSFATSLSWMRSGTLLGLIVLKFKTGVNWAFKNFQYRFSLFSKQSKRIDLFWKKQIYFSAYFDKTVFQLYDFQILRELISKQRFTLICTE